MTDPLTRAREVLAAELEQPGLLHGAKMVDVSQALAAIAKALSVREPSDKDVERVAKAVKAELDEQGFMDPEWQGADAGAEKFARAAIAAMPVRFGEWQPIETAPKDGTWVLLTGGTIDYGWDAGDFPLVVSGQSTRFLNGREADERWQFAWFDGGYYGEYENPTHWQPLPSKPVVEGEAND